MSQRKRSSANIAPRPARPQVPGFRHLTVRASRGVARQPRLRRWRALDRQLSARPLLVPGLLALASLVAYTLQAGMSERLRLTTQHLVNDLDRAISATMPAAGLFRAAVSWVPRQLPGSRSPDSPFLMAMVGYVLTLAVLFALYAAALWWLARHPPAPSARTRMLLLIGGAGAVFSTLLLFTPAAPSHDPFAYATGGRLLDTYHANPFFVVPSAYRGDPILAANEWQHSTIAYGPLWAALSALLNPLVGNDPLRANMVYRVVAYVPHLVNILLVGALLRQLPARHQAWRARGLLLYAWNPLVVIEVAAGHNDVLMLTLVLASLLLLTLGRRYPAMVCLGASILVKANAWPLALLILLALALKARPSTAAHDRLRLLAPAGTVLGVVVVGYLPFYWGHSPTQIAAAGRLEPSAQAFTHALIASFGTLGDNVTDSGLLPAALAASLARGLLALASPMLWTVVLAVLLLITTYMLLPALRRAEQLPAALAWVYAVWMVFISLFLLLRTWYLIPLVGLVCLTPACRPIRRFVVLLTATMQLSNLFLSRSPPFGGWQQWSWLPLVGVPLVVLVLDLRQSRFDWRATARASQGILWESLGWLGMAPKRALPGPAAGVEAGRAR